MVMRRRVRPNPLLKHLEEYRKSSKPSLELDSEEIKRLAHMQAEAFVNRPDMQNTLKDIIRT
ncbi:MAG: hypothetical protein OWQ59_01740 [Alicyclobacillaceae bacterium]|jgi:hypothetical protein|nr:hypothetical protein [Alicyclobacillaceae bacterium]MCY0895041.1 hypothetical protein [Alicyclobacillaceae bacterium]